MGAQRRESQEAHEPEAIAVVAVDVAPVNTAHREVENAGVGKVVPWVPSHDSTLAKRPPLRIGGYGQRRACQVPGTVPGTWRMRTWRAPDERRRREAGLTAMSRGRPRDTT